MFPIEGKVQHYAWGGKVFIPRLLGISNTEQLPFAEYWMGVHTLAPAKVRLSSNAFTGLHDLIRSEPRRYLGRHLADHFHDLPFLLKVLDVKDMLSIQVHPTLEEARKGFEEENASGIPLDAPHRNYKDTNHKPEIMLALGEFWLLHGFRSEELMRDILEKVDALHALLPIFESRGYRGLYQYVMELPQEGVHALLQPLADEILPKYDSGQLKKTDPHFWAARAMRTYPDAFDRGIFSIYFFNLVHVQPGQAVFQAAGVPHAYLEGQNVELMSNSDNVLRGGLTPKHVDVKELMKHIRFHAVTPEVMDGQTSGAVKEFRCPVPDFSLSQADLRQGTEMEWETRGPEILLFLSGEGTAEGGAAFEYTGGRSFFAGNGERIRVRARQDSRFVRAWVP